MTPHGPAIPHTPNAPHAARPGPAARLLIAGVRLYQFTIAGVLGGRCRFHPSCSEYAVEALITHGPVRGTWLAARRLARCHPLAGSGVDPVPPPRSPTLRPDPPRTPDGSTPNRAE
jgi:hypothetical protein